MNAVPTPPPNYDWSNQFDIKWIFGIISTALMVAGASIWRSATWASRIEARIEQESRDRSNADAIKIEMIKSLSEKFDMARANAQEHRTAWQVNVNNQLDGFRDDVNVIRDRVDDLYSRHVQ